MPLQTHSSRLLHRFRPTRSPRETSVRTPTPPNKDTAPDNEPVMPAIQLSDIEYIAHLSAFLNSYDGRLESRLSPLIYACFCASFEGDNDKVTELRDAIREDFHGAEQVYKAFCARYGKKISEEVQDIVESMRGLGERREFPHLAEMWGAFVKTMAMKRLREFVGEEEGMVGREEVRRGSELFLSATDPGSGSRDEELVVQRELFGGEERRMWWGLLLIKIMNRGED
ncbi:hypothetical protein CC80DRAFT_129746 [Byssothecium circinans]|uniref:Uncharacterized protein n=1 Tax=Byssothecium circinans TaxID=147558 RepID=A0A6A5TP35_9PLEO|nr:hypothetical protein CC80DRAFT_129746 [Byssothecium circinans]